MRTSVVAWACPKCRKIIGPVASVMGRSLKQKSSRWFSLKPTLLLILRIVLCLALLTQQVMGCGVEQCSTNYNRRVQRDKLMIGGNVRYCIALKNYDKCLQATSRPCRGNLKYHTLVSMVSRQITKFNCTHVPDTPIGTVPYSNYDDRCIFQYTGHSKGGSGHRFCQVFGDPHLRTFNGQYETCKTVGAWPVVDNSYFAVQVTNERVSKNSPATGITKVTVIVKSFDGCVSSQKLYEATSDSLPTYFVDGTSSVGDRVRPAIQVISKDLGRHIEIKLRHIATRIFIRRHGLYLSIAVRMPEQVIQEQSPVETGQLCLSGCQSREVVPYKEALAAPELFAKCHPMQRTFTKSQAARLCREVGVTDFYFDACVFDLLMSGNLVFRDAARDALKDTRILYPPYRRHYETNRTDLTIYDHFESTCSIRPLPVSGAIYSYRTRELYVLFFLSLLVYCRLTIS